jgi:hypothetical protein
MVVQAKCFADILFASEEHLLLEKSMVIHFIDDYFFVSCNSSLY